jgi:hypothetical protein
MPGNAWGLSTINILSSLNKEPVVDGCFVKDLQYSILDDSHVSYHDPQTLAELHQINPLLAPKEFVAFRSERLAWHETIVAVSTRIATEDESDMQCKCMIVYDEALKLLGRLKLEQVRANIKRNITYYVNAYLSGEDIKDRPNGEDIIKLCDQVLKLDPNTFGKFKEGFTAKDAIILRATDIHYTKEANKCIQRLLEFVIHRTVVSKRGLLQLLTIPDPERRHTFMIAGGQASGKGSSVERIKVAAREKGILWHNIVKINTDSYKTLLLQPGTTKAELYSQLAQEEASLIHQKIQSRLAQMAAQGVAPHVFVDLVFVGEDKIKMGLVKKGTVQCIVVSTDVGDAIERSYQRGLMDGKTGRYENTKGILQGHKRMSQQVPSTLAGFIGCNVQLLLVDNNVPKGEQPDDVMSIDLKTKRIEIRDPVKLQRFIHKCQINDDADSRANLYTEQLEEPSYKVYLEPLLKGERCSLKTTAQASNPADEQREDETERQGYHQGR